MIIVLGLLGFTVGILFSGMTSPGAFRRAFMAYVFMCFLSNLILSYFGKVGYLGVPKAWSSQELFLAGLILLFPIVLPSSRLDCPFQKKIAHLIGIFTALIIISFIFGLIRPDSVRVTAIARKFLWLPIFFVALRVFTTSQSVERLFRWTQWVGLAIVLLHVLMYSRLIDIGLTHEQLETMGINLEVSIHRRLGGLLGDTIYLFAIAVSMTQIFARRKYFLSSWIIILACTLGVLLAQSRGMYLALASMGLASLVVFSARVKVAAIGSLSIVLMFILLMVLPIDVFSRFTFKYHRVETPLSVNQYSKTWRGQEWMDAYHFAIHEPHLLLTGQGFGVIHKAGGAAKSLGAAVNFYHNEYLKVFVTLGVVGLICYLVMFFWAIRGRPESKTLGLNWIFMPLQLYTMSILLSDFFGGYVFSPTAGPLYFSLLAILANGQHFFNEHTYLNRFRFRHDQPNSHLGHIEMDCYQINPVVRPHRHKERI